MNKISTDWAYFLGKPSSSAQFKSEPQDFIVEESLGYEPTGDGEHVFLWVEKQGLNTAFVAEQLAKHTGLPLRQITYAGRKDKHAITRQWFGVHAPKGLNKPLDAFSLEGFTLLRSTKHQKKLKIGQLEGNRFSIVLKDVSHEEEVDARLRKIQTHGVPNYFGEQRFGVMQTSDGQPQMGGTLALGLRMVEGEVIRNRNKRNLAVSAVRSALFNQLVSERIKDGWFNEVRIGDACELSGSNSFFVECGKTLVETSERYHNQDLSPTAALAGLCKDSVTSGVLAWENQKLTPFSPHLEMLKKEGLVAARRAIKIWPKNLEWQWKHDTLHLQFSLPAGCFATSVLRECIQFNPFVLSGQNNTAAANINESSGS